MRADVIDPKGPLQQPEISSDLWEQDVPVGGENLPAGRPAAADAVVPVGITVTREAPPLKAVANAIPVQNGQIIRIAGRTPQRRRILISGTAAFILCTSEGEAQQGTGLSVAANMAPITITAAVDLWAQASGAGLITFLAEFYEG